MDLAQCSMMTYLSMKGMLDMNDPVWSDEDLNGLSVVQGNGSGTWSLSSGAEE